MTAADVAAVSGRELVHRTDALVTRWRRLREESVVLGDLLHDRIGLLDGGDPRRPALVAVRRSVHALRRPPDHLGERVGDAPGPEAARRVEAWVDRLRDAVAARDALDRAFHDDLDDRWLRLRAACDDQRFRTAVGSVSPSLSLVLESWLRDPTRRPRRRSLITLLRYLDRAATRASPLSGFSTVLLGRLDPLAAGPAVQVDDHAAVAALEVDQWTWDGVLRGVVGSSAPTLDLALSVNPTLERAGDSLRYLRPGWDERWSSVAATPVVLASWRAVVEAGAGGELAVATLLAEAAGREPHDVVPLLRRLVGAGVLHAHPRTAWPSVPTDAPPVTSAAADPALHDALGRLALALPPRVDVGSVPAARVSARRHLDEVAELVGAGTGPDGATGEAVRDTLLAGPGGLVLPGAAWSPVLPDLDLVAAWTALLDPLLGYRLVLAELVRRMPDEGAEPSVLALHRRVEQVLAEGSEPDLRPFLTPDHVGREDLLLDSSLPALRDLGRRRAAWRSELLDAATPGVDPQGRTVLRVDPATVRRHLAGAPAVHVPPPTVACYVHPFVVAGDLRVVLGTVHGGDGRGRSRWTHLCSLPFPPPPAPRDGEPEPVELDGTWGSNLNLRSPVTRRAIEYPGASRSRSATATVALAGLRVRRDVATGLPVLLDADGSVLRVAHTGMMTEAVVPSLARLLVGGFGTSYLQHAATPVVPVPDPGDPGTRGPSNGHRPRVEVGRVVLARACWTVAPDDVPRRAPDEGEGSFLLRVATWADDLGLPREVFVRMATARRGDEVLDNDHKPLHVDLRQVGTVLLLDRLAADVPAGRHLLVEEALPVPGDAGLGDEAPSAVEVVLERRLGRAPH